MGLWYWGFEEWEADMCTGRIGDDKDSSIETDCLGLAALLEMLRLSSVAPLRGQVPHQGVAKSP